MDRTALKLIRLFQYFACREQVRIETKKRRYFGID